MALVLLAAGCTGSSSVGTTPAVTEGPQVTTPPSSSSITTVAAGVEEHTFLGADGVTSQVEDLSRIITLSGDLTEIVFALGMGESVVATDVTTIYPPEAVGLPIVGVGRFLTAEGVLGENPTLVIGDMQTSPLETIQQIRSAGVPVAIMDVPVTFEGLYGKIEQIGLLLGREDAARDLASRVRTAIDDVLSSVPEHGAPPRIAFVYSRGPDVMLLFGAEMTTRPLIEAVGGVDVGAAAGVVGTVSVTPEALVAAAPDVIVITSEGLQALGGIDGLLAQPGFAETPAGRDRRILDYPEGDILTFGPRIAETLGQLSQDLQDLLGES